MDWIDAVAEEIQGVSLLSAEGVRQVIERHCPFKSNVVYEEVDFNLRQQIMEKLEQVQREVDALVARLGAQ